MSSKKEKLVEEAQKLVSRGQLDKAIKLYQQVVALDTSAFSQRQKLAELLVKTGRAEEARSEYETIGKYYASNGFYLKAIAVYKQMQKLFPQDIDIILSLAGFNEKHGLVGNALAEYKQVYDYYEKTGTTDEALKILEKMQSIDQQNINIKLKLAEAYFQARKKDDSYALFGQLAMLLQERGDTEAFAKLNERILQFFPEKTDFMLEVLAKQVEEGNVAKAVNGLQALLKSNPQEKGVWELIVRAYCQLNQPEKLKEVYQHFLRFFPNELSARIGLITCYARENDIKGALVLLDSYEQDIFAAGAFDELVTIYRILDRLDPMNLRVLQALSRACEAVGRADEVAALAPKIRSLSKLSSEEDVSSASGTQEFQNTEITSEEIMDIEDTSGSEDEDADAGVFLLESVEADADSAEVELPVPVVELEADAFEEFVGLSEDEEIEIEVEIDDDFAFEFAPGAEGEDVVLSDEWRDSFADIFEMITTSPRGVKFGSALDGSDAQSHYDLGVAFKEMGLYDEAINEFRQAAVDPVRRVECLVWQAACLRERGELDTAESVLNALMKPELSLEDSCAVKYELALTFELLGKNDQAAVLMTEIDSLDPSFRDIRLRSKDDGDDRALDFSDEDLQDFELK